MSDTAALPSTAEMEHLARTDPLAFLENCLQRCRREVRAYRAVWLKQDRVDGLLRPKALIEVCFREEPYSLFLRWREGTGKAESVLYVEGENDNKLLARLSDAFLRQLLGEVVPFDPDGPEVTQAAPLPVTKFGFRHSIERALADCQELQKKGELDLKFLGEAVAPEAGDRTCYRFQYTPLEPGEGTAHRRLTLYLDKDTWLLVGRVGAGEDGEPVNISFYRDVRLNPDFAPDQFQRSALAPKA
jgi:Protein of unknown function (DUF1571)